MAADKDRNWVFAQNWVEQMREDMENVHLESLSFHCNIRCDGIVQTLLVYLSSNGIRADKNKSRRVNIYKDLTR